LTTINAKKDKQFYNQHNGTGNWVLKEHTSETKAKMRKPKSLEHREKLKGNQNAAGVVKSRETIEKSIRANLGRKNTTEVLKNLKKYSVTIIIAVMAMKF